MVKILTMLNQIAQATGYLLIALLLIIGTGSFFIGNTAPILGAERIRPLDSANQGTNAAFILEGSVSTPQFLAYEGMLRDSFGEPVTGVYTMTFRIYDDLMAPISTALWSESQSGVSIKGGAFAVLLGNSIPIPSSLFDDADRYLGVTVLSDNGDALTEDNSTSRKRFASVPYAMRAGSAPKLHQTRRNGIVLQTPDRALYTSSALSGSLLFTTTSNLAFKGSNGLQLYGDDEYQAYILLGSSDVDIGGDVRISGDAHKIAGDLRVTGTLSNHTFDRAVSDIEDLDEEVRELIRKVFELEAVVAHLSRGN